MNKYIYIYIYIVACIRNMYIYTYLVALHSFESREPFQRKASQRSERGDHNDKLIQALLAQRT
jgi:hypothetical protein